MGKEIFSFSDIKIEKRKFYRYKFFFFEDVYINNALVSSKISSR